MKRVLYLIAAAAMVLMLASCDKTKKDPTPSKSADIVGTWFFTWIPAKSMCSARTENSSLSMTMLPMKPEPGN